MSDLIGQMRKSVQFCLNIPSSQGAGYTDNYGVLLTTRGKLEQSSGNRSLSFGEIEGRSSHTLIVRYQQAIEVNVSISAKWLIDGVFYTIESWEKIEEINFYYKFRVNKKEPVSSGTAPHQIAGAGLQPLYITPEAGQKVASMGIEPSEIVLVARSGLIYNKTAGTPGNFEWQQAGTTLNFNTDFSGETVYVLYKLSG